MPQLQTAFAIGNSVAVTIPKRLGVLPGFRYRNVPSKGKRIVYEPVEEGFATARSVSTKGSDKAVFQSSSESSLRRSATKSKNEQYKQYLEYYKARAGAIKLNMTTKEFMKIKKYCHDHFYEEG